MMGHSMTKTVTKDSQVGGFQVVSFLIRETTYAVNIGRVREIIYFKKPTPLPEAPPFVEGILDLRGTVVPIIDLKKKMGMAAEAVPAPKHILIINIKNSILGIIVDEVREVLQLMKDQIQAPQKIHKGPGARYLTGVSKVGEKMVFLLDLDALLTGDEQARLGEI
jgi:purine-binding chemotaxis protein CheW